MSEAPSRRSRVVALLAVLLLAAGVLRIGLVVLHAPLAGYANQYDMARTSACLGVWPDVPAAQRALAAPDAPMERYRHGGERAAACYPSTTVALLAVALATDRVAEAIAGAQSRSFDLRQFGVLQALLLAAVALALHRRLRGQPGWRLGHAAFFALVLADPFNTLHLNTLYTEAAALIALYAVFALLLHWTLPRDRGPSLPAHAAHAAPPHAATQPAARPSAADATLPGIAPALLALLVLCLLALGFSRVQHLLLPLALLPVFALVLWRRGRSGRLGSAALLVAAVLVLLLQGVQQQRNAGIDAANRSNAVLGALLPAATDVDAMTARLGLPAACASLEHVTWYLRRGRDIASECPQLSGVPLTRIAAALLADPRALAVLAGRGLAQATAWRLPYLGEVAAGTYQRLPQPSVADALARLGFAWHAWLWLVPLLCLPLQAARWRRRALAPSELLLVAATAVIALGWTSALLGDGYSELTRHLHLAQNALLLAWVLLACRAADSLLRMRGAGRDTAIEAWPLAVAVLLAAVLAQAWLRLPLAEGVLQVRAGNNGELRVEGWALDPSGVHALAVGTAAGMHAVEPLPAAAVARLFPLPAGSAPTAARFSASIPIAADAQRLRLQVTGASGQRSEADALQLDAALRGPGTR